MIFTGRPYRPLVLMVALGSLIGCDSVNNVADPDNEPLPDFSLSDVNPDSPRYQEAISPRDYLGRISAWYFGHST